VQVCADRRCAKLLAGWASQPVQTTAINFGVAAGRQGSPRCTNRLMCARRHRVHLHHRILNGFLLAIRTAWRLQWTLLVQLFARFFSRRLDAPFQFNDACMTD